MPGAGSARGDEANRAAVPPRSFARISGVQAAARPPRVALMGGCISVHRTFALFRGSARAGAVIPNERIIPGLRPIPAERSLRHPTPAVLLPSPPSRGRAVMAISGGKPCQIPDLTPVSRKGGESRPGSVSSPGSLHVLSLPPEWGGDFRRNSQARLRGGETCPVPPPWRYPHGPLHGEIPEENRIRLIPGYSRDTNPRAV